VTPPPARLTPKGAARRASIIEHATGILIRQGHGALSLHAVAAAAGVSLGNLQYYFPTRVALIGALLDRHLTEALDRVRAVLPPPADPGRTPADPDRAPADDDRARGELSGALEVILAAAADPDGATLFLEIWAMSRHDPAVAGAVRGFYDRYVELVAAAIGGTDPGRARLLVGLLEGITLLQAGVVAAPDADTDRLLRQVLLRLAAGR
jgi:AcrR family transcriptional regulator